MTDWSASVHYTGAIYTPVEVATSIVERCSNLLGTRSLRVLEPSVGDGAFLPGLTGMKSLSTSVMVIDINEHVIGNLEHRYHNQFDTLKFVKGDFIQFAIDRTINGDEYEKFNLIVGNPPFIRRHNFSVEMAESVNQLSFALDYPLNSLKNTWSAFLIASAKLVSEDGIVAFVLPYELLTVDYGQKALNHFQQEFERVDIIVSKERAFPEIYQDAIILIAQKKSLKKKGLYITRVRDFQNLSARGARKIKLQNGVQSGIELNSYLLPTASVELIRRLQSQARWISDFLTSAPGVVSAANDFFIRTKADIDNLGLANYAKPILKRSSFTSSTPVFTSADFCDLAKREPCFLLHFGQEQEELSIAGQAYIQSGEDQEIHLRYKCRNRTNWYQVPLVEPESAFVFKRSHSHPRVLLNEASVYTTDTAYGLRLKDGCTARGFCFSFYTSPTMLFAEMNGRFYGGGVLELSPSEFRSLALFYHEPTDEEFGKFLQVHQAAVGNIDEMLDFGDQWLIANGHLTTEELKIIRESWATIRAHRMRHGGRSSV